jgi:mannan endo-1,4-beta-mannosidase
MTAGELATDILGPAGMWRIIRPIVLVFTAAALIRLLPYRPPDAVRPRRRARPQLLIPAVIAGIVVLAVGCGYSLTRGHNPVRAAEATVSHTGTPAVTSEASAGVAAGAATAPAATAPAATAPKVGIFEPGATASYQPVDAFMAAAGTRPGIVLYYSGWGEPFQIRFATWAREVGAVPFAQMEPAGIKLADVTAGDYDSYLRSFASAVRAYGHQVILGFAPEMNGNWYAWGAGHTSPAVWVSAWQHVVTVFRRAGAANVTWLWTVNSVNAAAAPLQQWWPGAVYVDWVGIDGYYYTSHDSFASVFGTTISQVRGFTAAPILISETAVGPGPAQVAQIGDLFAGVHADHLAGLVWFDMTQDGGEYHQDWRLENSPAGLAAFTRDAAWLESSSR